MRATRVGRDNWRRTFQWVIVCVATLLSVGCASMVGTMQETGAQLVNSNAIAAVADGKGRIFFYRLSGVFGSGQRPEIKVDGVTVGRSVPGEGFYLDISSGTHAIALPVILYPGESGTSVHVGAGETVYIRTSMDMSAFIGRTVITVMDPSTAAQEVSTVTIYAVNPTGHDPGGDAQRH